MLDRINIKPKPLANLPNLEDMRPHVTHTFTVNPKEQFDDGKPHSKTRLQRVRDHIRRILPHHCFEYKLVMEISKMGRIHAHGYIWINNLLEFYMDVVPQLKTKCSFEIDYLNNDDVWSEYIWKQQHIIKGYENHCVLTRFHENSNNRTHIIKETVEQEREGPND